VFPGHPKIIIIIIIIIIIGIITTTTTGNYLREAQGIHV